MAELPCDADGMCMVCKVTPSDAEVLLCNSCSSPWHMSCLNPPLPCVPVGDWFCPDCEPSSQAAAAAAGGGAASVPPSTNTIGAAALGDDVVSRIRAIRADPNLSEQEKARKCQDVMTNTANGGQSAGAQDKFKKHEMLDIFDENLNCIFCMQLADRPVTTPCGHNFCLKCFQRWIGHGKKACGKCRTPIPAKMASQPRINSALVVAIRMAKSASTPCSNGPPKPYHYIQNQDRPDKCFTTERAKRSGKANAASGKIFVTVPPDHFGPITAENDPVRAQGVLVGETWEDRMECRQWGAHLPHVAGIAGQSEHGAQSVALSGGYEDDEDHGEWFLYTGSGGRDLSGNRRTNDKQSFDQQFEKSNLALKVSCRRGYPVRVVRSHKEKRSSYAPENGVRYDGIYRIEKCWRKNGIQGFKVCRYLFVRCDNEPAPWTSDEIGDRPRSLPKINELKGAVDVTERKCEPAWDWKEEEGVWGWVKPQPTSKKAEDVVRGGHRQGSRKSLSMGQRLLKEFGCDICKKVLKLPLSTPCGHNFCKSCLLAAFAGQGDVRERHGVGGRSLRVQKVIKRCPSCQGDINEFLVNPQVNRQMEDVIQSLRRSAAEEDGSDAEMDKGDEEEQSCGTEKTAGCSGTDVVSVPEIKEGEAASHIQEENNSSVKPTSHIQEENKSSVKPTSSSFNEKEFLDLCKKYPEYSEELLRSMLMDQEGDILELKYLLKALQKQQKKQKSKGGNPSLVGGGGNVGNGDGCAKISEEGGNRGAQEEVDKKGGKRGREELDDNGAATEKEEISALRPQRGRKARA